MNRTQLLMACSLFGLGMILTLLNASDRSKSSASGDPQDSLMLYCAASNRAVMEVIREDYQKEFGRKVDVQYGPSQTLLSSIEVTRSGDLFLPADDSYLDMAHKKALVAEVLPIARMQAVVAVRRDTLTLIEKFSDLIRDDVRLVLANPDTAAIGRVVREVLNANNRWESIATSAIAMRTTVNEVANDVEIGAADAGIVYDAVLHTYDNLQSVELTELTDATSQVSVGVIASTNQPQAALHFARFISAHDRGLQRYSEFGFRTEGGDVWSDVPELSIFAGSMLRPAIEQTIEKFERREGITVNRVYNGCGILVAQMKAGQRPDAYFASDREFMIQVHDLFSEPVPVSHNELVILVQKGNPKGIQSLRDLTRKDLRVGIGHEKQSALGWITQNTFREVGIQKEVIPNVTVQSPTGDMLVNQLLTGALDTAVAYRSNAAGASESLDALRIHDIACSVATQPWAVAEESRYPDLTGRLFQQICSQSSQQTFAAEGFQWQVEANP